MRARDFIGENINFYDRFGHDNTTPDETMWRVSFSDGEDVVRVRAKDKQQAITRATAIAKSQGNPYPSVDWVKPVKEGVAEGGPFSYSAKKSRKGSVADLADKKRREQEQGKQPVEPRDQQVGTARVTKGVSEGMDQDEYNRIVSAISNFQDEYGNDPSGKELFDLAYSIGVQPDDVINVLYGRIVPKKGVAEGSSKRDQKDVAAIKAAIERLRAQLSHPNADRAAIQQSIEHERKRLALYGQGVSEGAKWRSNPDAHDINDDGDIYPKTRDMFAYDPLTRRQSTAGDARTARGKKSALKTSLKMAQGRHGPKSQLPEEQGVAEGDKMSLINLDQSLANTPPVWKKFISSLPPQLAREFVDERPRPDQDDIDFLTPLRLVSPQPVTVRVADLLRHPENQATIGRSPDDVVAAVNQRWGLKIPSGKKYDPNPARYRAYAQMAPGTASPSVMADGVILFGAGRFVAAALRGDETMRVWSMTRKQGVSEDPITERSKDYYERERAADAIGDLIDRLRQDRYKNVTPDVIRQMKQWVNTTGRARTIYGGANHDRFGSAGELLDMLGNRYRELQMRSGQMPEFQGRANTARDMAQQIAQQTRGQYEYNRPRTWTTGAGQRYRDPQDYIRYPDEQSLEDAQQWLESRGQKVYYKDNFGNLNTAIRIGRYVVEPASITRGVFSQNPETEHRMSVRSAAAINQSVRSQVDITDQQAAALKDIADSRTATALTGIRAIMAILKGEQELKRVIDSSKKIDPRDKAKLDAIITAAGRQQGRQ